MNEILAVALSVVSSLLVGIILVLVPWTALWDSNYLLQPYPALRTGPDPFVGACRRGGEDGHEQEFVALVDLVPVVRGGGDVEGSSRFEGEHVVVRQCRNRVRVRQCPAIGDARRLGPHVA